MLRPWRVHVTRNHFGVGQFFGIQRVIRVDRCIPVSMLDFFLGDDF